MRVLSLKDLLSFYIFRVMVYAQIRYFCILDINPWNQMFKKEIKILIKTKNSEVGVNVL